MDFNVCIIKEDKAMAMEITGDYISHAMQNMARNNAKAASCESGADRAQKADWAAVYTSSVREHSQRLADYARELAKLAPSVQVKVGTAFSSDRSGKTLTINPSLLNKMQHDPKQAQDTKEMIKGVEFITKFMDGLYKSTGKVLLYRHSYIDADGKYRCFSRVKDVRGEKMSAALRGQRQKNSQNLIARTKANAAKSRKQIQNLQAKRKGKVGSNVNIRL